MNVLKLHSPFGAKPISYTWPLTSNCENVKSKKNTVPAIIETMQWICYDYPEIQCAFQNNILADYDINSYESMKNVCNRFNKIIKTLTKLENGTSLSQKRIKTQASRDLLRHIMQQVYIRAVDNPRKLNEYEPFSREVYGETSYDYVCQIIDNIQATREDVFIDLGSGVGQVVLQMAASTPCKLCIGIECAKNPNIFALKMDKYFQEWMAWFGKKYGNYELIQGDFLDAKFQTKIRECSIFFTNNILFGPYINYRLQETFSSAKDGTKIISSRNFCQRNFRISNRNQNDIGRIMSVIQLHASPDSVSWTGKPFSFYLHEIDRTKQHEFCNQMSISTISEESKNKGPTEKRKIGRPRSVPIKKKEDYTALDQNSRSTSVKNIGRPRSAPPKENEEFYPELMQNSRRTFVKQKIDKPGSVPVKEKEDYQGLKNNSRKTLVIQEIDKPRLVPVKEKRVYQGLKKKSRRTLAIQKTGRQRSVPVKEKEDYLGLKNNSRRTLMIQEIDKPRSVPVKEKRVYQGLKKKPQITLAIQKTGRQRSVPVKEKENNRPKLVQNSQRTSAREKQEHHPKLLKNSRSVKFALDKEKEEHHVKSRITSVKKNIGLPRPAAIKEKKKYHPQVVRSPLSPIEEFENSEIDYSRCNTFENNAQVARMLTKKIDRPLKTIKTDKKNSILKISLNKLETSDKNSSSCYGNTTRNLNELPKKVGKYLKTARDKITKPLSTIYEEYEHLNYSDSENTDQELNKLQEIGSMQSLGNSDISVSGLICPETLQNTDTRLFNKTLELNDSESIASVDSFSKNKNANFQTNIVRPNTPTPISKNQRRLQKESTLFKKLALLQKQVNSQRTHNMILRKKTIGQSIAASENFINYLSNKIKQNVAIISKNNENDLKLSHNNNSKIIKRIFTKTKYPEISPSIEKNTGKIYAKTKGKIIRPKLSEVGSAETPTRTHNMILRKKTIGQSIAASENFINYLSNKIKQNAAKISKNNENDLKLSHTNNSKIIKRIFTKTKYPKISPCIEKNTGKIYPKTKGKIISPKLSEAGSTPEIPSGRVCTEKHSDMVYPELSTRKISTGIPSTTRPAIELNNYCKQFQKMVECDTINKDKIIAFQNAINEQDFEKNKTLQRNYQTTVKINYAKRMKERDLRNYLKRKLFRNSNQIKKVTPKRELQRKLVSKIKNTSHSKSSERKIYEDNDDNISVSSIASPEYTPFVTEDVDIFFKDFLQSNKRENL